MPSPADRDYVFVARTYDLPRGTSPAEAFAACREGMAAMVGGGLFRNARVLESIGAVDLVADEAPVRPWNVFTLCELAEGADREAALRVEAEAFAAATQRPLSRHILRRPAGAGLAVPRPGPHFAALPDRFAYAVEYIWVPPARRDEYMAAMRDIFGPIGIALVAQGHAYKVVITEVIETLDLDPSMPRFNQIHLLSGDFDDRVDGFTVHADAVVRGLGRGAVSTEQALRDVARYREKPRMSKSREVVSLCVGLD